VTSITSQPISPAMVVILANHPKTIEELLPRLRYTSGMKMSEAATARYGVPNLFVRSRNCGACLHLRNGQGISFYSLGALSTIIVQD
jgi:hypothetical protein